MPDKLLLENGDAILLESGEFLLMDFPHNIGGFQALECGQSKWPGLHAIEHGAVQFPALIGGGEGGGTTWNPADKSAQITLSNGDLTATGDTSTFYPAVHSTTTKSAGKRYAEFQMTEADGNENCAFGLADTTHDLAEYLGQTGTSIGLWDSGAIYPGGFGTGLSYTTGVLRLAVDFTAQIVWLGNQAGWDGDPDTGTGGRSISSMGSSLFLAACIGGDSPANSCTMNAGGSAFTHTLPAGFSAWDS